VKTTKSGAEGSALTAATACRSVLAAGIGRTFEAQCESESWTKRNRRLARRTAQRFVQAPAGLRRKTMPPRPAAA